MSTPESLPRIHPLSEEVTNQIAAGEVIERPASVLKELIENSIDASASKILIDIEQSGIGLIRIRDDGQGIHKDDLKLALQSHATSKLSDVSDFAQIVSLGFRGEALPSIASVSVFMLTSRNKNTENAWSIDNQYKIKPAAHETGTTVAVKNLFYSTPARRKFLKSDRTEFLHIQALLRAIALSRFSIGFFVKNEGQPLFRFPACKNEADQRIGDVCGRTFLNKSVVIDANDNGMRLWGWFGLNDVARSQSDRQYFYVNGRYIHNRHVNHAIRLAYGNRIDKGRYPSFVLHLEVDPAQVDINVHPTKSEVRFADTRNIHDFVYRSLLDAFNTPIVSLPDEESYKNIAPNQRKNIHETSGYYSSELVQQTDLLPDKKKYPPKYTAVLAGQFIITTIDDTQYLIDIGKARIFLTEDYLYRYYQSDTIIQHPIMVPIAYKLRITDMDVLSKHVEPIKQWGFQIEPISPDHISIRAIPSRLVYADTIALVKDFITVLGSKKDDRAIAKKLATHVNDAGLISDNNSIQQLINQVHGFEKSNPHKSALPWRKLDQYILRALLEN